MRILCGLLLVLGLALLSGCGGRPPALTLYSPEVSGLTVRVNGVVTPGTPGTHIVRIRWEWGDGTADDQWFPAVHTYRAAGPYTITVTAFQSDGSYTTQRVAVTLTAGRKVRVYVYAIEDAMRFSGYNIVDVMKIPGAQIRVDFPGGSWVLTTTSMFPGPYVEVDEHSTVTVSLVAEPSGWRFTNFWDIYTVSWTPGPTRTFNVGTTDKHVAASFTRMTPTSPPYLLFPPNMHLLPGETASAPLRVIDSQGRTVSGSVAFEVVSNRDLVSVTADGRVRALRSESPHEAGAYIMAYVDGVQVASGTVVRVLPIAVESEFSWEMGRFTAWYYPSRVRGEDLREYFNRYEILRASEYGYRIQEDLMGTRPFEGARQIFAVELQYELGKTQEARVCGWAGNPIRLGWDISSSDPWHNCFLVPHVPPRSPQWTVFFHELGHTFTWASPTFTRALVLETFLYSEAIATALGLATVERLIVEGYQGMRLGPESVTSMQRLLESDIRGCTERFERWLAAGARFRDINPDIVDGIWLHYARQRPRDFVQRFFRPLQPRFAGELSAVLNLMRPGDEHTIFAALTSAAFGADLSEVFARTFNYPLRMELFRAAYAVFLDICNR